MSDYFLVFLNLGIKIADKFVRPQGIVHLVFFCICKLFTVNCPSDKSCLRLACKNKLYQRNKKVWFWILYRKFIILSYVVAHVVIHVVYFSTFFCCQTLQTLFIVFIFEMDEIFFWNTNTNVHFDSTGTFLWTIFANLCKLIKWKGQTQ